jgi:NAD(P)-dependent dehydrogenase (short-subunit alcohol dehydrogenase family)
MSQESRHAIVVGASTGIGAATARALAARGFHVFVLGRRRELLEELAAEIGGSAAVLDVTSAGDVDAVLTRCAAAADGIDVAVYVAGMLEIAPIKDHPLELWERTLAVNLTGAFLTTRALFTHMRPGGHLVFVSSVAGREGAPLMSAYSASKGGLERFAEAAAGELGRRGVGVHVVAPGQVATPMLDREGTSPYQLEPERVGELIAWLGELPPDVVLKDLVIEATSTGPFAIRRDVEPISSSNDNQGAP